MNARAVVLASVGLFVSALVCASAGASSTLAMLAQSPGERTDGATIWFQGYLAASSTGEPLSGNYDILAAIYSSESGGSLVWGPETHSGTPVAAGWFNIELGATVSPLPDFATPPYYLQLTIDGEQLSPRQKMASVPSAIRSGDDGDWDIVGDDLYHASGTVNVGVAPPPAAGRQGETDGERSALASRQAMGLYSYEENGLGVYGAVTETDNAADWRNGLYGFRSRSVSAPGSSYAAGETNNGVAGYTVWGDPYTFGVAGYSYNDFTRTGGVLGAEWDGSPWAALGYRDESGNRWGAYTPDAAYVGGNLGVGTATPASKLDVAGTARMAGFTMPTGAAAGRVLMSDGSGNGSWQSAPGTIGGSGTAGYVPKFTGATTLGNSGIYDNGTSVGIGTTSPGAKLAVQGTTSGAVVDVVSTYSGSQDYVMKVERTNVGASFDDVLRVQAPTSLGSQEYLLACRDGSGAAVFHIDGKGYMIASGGGTFGQPGVPAYGSASAGTFLASGASSDTKALTGEFNASDHVDAVGVYGQSMPYDYYGIGGEFEGGWAGVLGFVEPTGANWYLGVRGEVLGGSGTNYAVYGYASGTGTNYGVYGTASGGTSYAGYFSGAVYASGGYGGPKAGMKIDDPLDPANKYLSHSFVGSSEMMDIYSGNVVLDGSGAARVELPDWFEVLNQDFRYQLTCIGGFAPVYIAEKIAGGSFRIAGGTPGMEVSWQVTAIRHDPVALKQRTDVVQEKPAREAGKYLNPEAYGLPETAAVGYVEKKVGQEVSGGQ